MSQPRTLQPDLLADLRDFFPQESFEAVEDAVPIIHMDPDWLAAITVHPSDLEP